MNEKSLKNMGSLELMKLAKLGQATEKGLKVIVESIPCKGIYRSSPCKEKNTYTLGCALRYFCELKTKEKEAAIHDK